MLIRCGKWGESKENACECSFETWCSMFSFAPWVFHKTDIYILTENTEKNVTITKWFFWCNEPTMLGTCSKDAVLDMLWYPSPIVAKHTHSNVRHHPILMLFETRVCTFLSRSDVAIYFYGTLSNEMNKMISKTARKTPYFNLLL